MKNILIYLILIITTIASTQNFEVTEQIRELPGDLAARHSAYPDNAGNPCALIKLFSNQSGLVFENPMALEHTIEKDGGEYWIYMKHGARRITVKKEGFLALNYEFPIGSLQRSTTYRMSVSGIAEHATISEIAIVVQADPSDAKVYINDKEMPEPDRIITTLGKQTLKVTRDGYEPYITEIDVTPTNIRFPAKLEKIQDAVILIDSNPPGAMVFIDGVRLDRTPVSTFYPAGTYKIRLTSDNYEDIEETIEIKSPETKKTYQLTDIRATLTINTHEKAKVFINNEQVTNYRNLKLAPQQVTVRVEMNKAKTLEERIILGRRETKTLDMHPQISTGTIQIAVIPTDAEIELTGDGGEKYTGTGAKAFTEVPVGTYKLKVTKKGFKTHTEDIRLTDGATERKSVKLDEGADVSGDYIFVQGGSFTREGNRVTVSDFYIGKTEVTQAQYQAVMGKNPSHFKGDNLPVESVSWHDAVEFCKKLSQKEGVTYRLPTEAEWEYAARGGNQSKGFEYSGSSSIDGVAWYSSNSGSKTQPVGTKQPNELGIYDMSGNVWEWCSDWYDSNYYKNSPSNNPTGPSSGSFRVLRGGSWGSRAKSCRVAYRNYSGPERRFDRSGFRVVRLP